jgi:hypothetical protein
VPGIIAVNTRSPGSSSWLVTDIVGATLALIGALRVTPKLRNRAPRPPKLSHDCPCDAPKQRLLSQWQPIRLIGEVKETERFRRKIEDVREADFPFSKPPYAALWKSSIWRIQLVSGFHLGQIWATISKSLILKI